MNLISRPGLHQKVLWYVLRNLVFLDPLSNILEILAFVITFEIYMGLWTFRVDPDLADYPGVDGAHELLSKNIEAIS